MVLDESTNLGDRDDPWGGIEHDAPCLNKEKDQETKVDLLLHVSATNIDGEISI